MQTEQPLHHLQEFSNKSLNIKLRKLPDHINKNKATPLTTKHANSGELES